MAARIGIGHKNLVFAFCCGITGIDVCHQHLLVTQPFSPARIGHQAQMKQTSGRMAFQSIETDSYAAFAGCQGYRNFIIHRPELRNIPFAGQVFAGNRVAFHQNVESPVAAFIAPISSPQHQSVNAQGAHIVAEPASLVGISVIGVLIYTDIAALSPGIMVLIGLLFSGGNLVYRAGFQRKAFLFFAGQQLVNFLILIGAQLHPVHHISGVVQCIKRLQQQFLVSGIVVSLQKLRNFETQCS